MKRSAKASALLVILCAQSAFAGPMGGWFMKSPECEGMCKPGSVAAQYGEASLACPEGFTMEKNQLGLVHCVKRTLLPCPSGMSYGPDGTCCPAESACFPTIGGLCPAGHYARSNCSDIVAPRAEAAAPNGRRLQGLVSHMMPAVEVNAEKITPLLVLPKPLISMNVPEIITSATPKKLSHHQAPIVILPQPALSFIEPKIEINKPKWEVPKHDRIIPVLPQPKVSFLEPVYETAKGGLNIQHKTMVIDATRLGPKKTYDINLPPIEIPNMKPINVEYKPPARTIIDLSQFGPRDATVVKLPDVQINMSHPIKVLKDEAQVRFIDVGRAQKGPVYEFTLPQLPPKNKVTINLPKVNVSTVVLPGHKEKEVVAINVLPPDVHPNHELKVTIDATNASFLNLPKPLKIVPKGNLNDTRVQLVELPPIQIPELGPLLTLDMRKNKTLADKIKMPAGFPDRDLEVVKVALPTLPRMGRDVNITMPTIQLDRYLPAKAPAGDEGKLKTTVTAMNATLPSMNHIEALNKPLIKPGSFEMGFAKGGKGANPWGVKVTVEDVVTGGRGKASPIAVPNGDDKAALLTVLGEAAASAFDGKQWCSHSCCPVCKPQPEKVEYAEPIYTCADGCGYEKAAGKCVCAAAKVSACPGGMKMCDVGGLGNGVCVVESIHAKVCLAHGAVCLAQNKVPKCP